MNANQYVKTFCNNKYDKLSYDFVWINYFDDKKYHIPSFLTDHSELFLDNSNKFLKIHYPHLYENGFEHIIDEIIYNKILES